MGTGPLPETPDESTASARELLRELWRTNHELEVLSKWMLLRIGVSGPQRLVLRIVGECPGISAAEIAARAAVHPSTLTGVLLRLSDSGFLTRTRDAADGRRAQFQLTAAGAAVAAARRGTVEAAMQASIIEMSGVERATVAAWLGRFADALADEREEPSPPSPVG